MILAILQARMSSTRLPGKVLKFILDTPLLFLQIERIRRARRIDDIVVATTTECADDILADACATRGVAVYRGSSSDVLDRYVRAAETYAPKAVVRLTGDCPLTDWAVIDRVVETYLEGDFKYVSNCVPATYPDGLDVEVIDHGTLQIAAAEARLRSEREHVTLFVRKYPERFPAVNVRAPMDLSGLRWTVDEPEDFQLVRAIYEGLYPSKPDFSTSDVLEFLRAHPGLSQLNAHVVQNAGLQRSLAEDCVFGAR